MPGESSRTVKILDVISEARDCMWNRGFLYANLTSNQYITSIKIIIKYKFEVFF